MPKKTPTKQLTIAFDAGKENLLAQAPVSVGDEAGGLFLTDQSLSLITDQGSQNVLKLSTSNIAGKILP